MGMKIKLYYKDILVLHPEMTPEEIEERLKKLEEESLKLKEWPKIE